MARYQLSDPAKADIAATLKASETMHGTAARIRYRALLSAALRRIAADPQGTSTVDRGRSFPIRHSRNESREVQVANAVHVIFYRAVSPGVVEIVPVLHERMDPRRHI